MRFASFRWVTVTVQPAHEALPLVAGRNAFGAGPFLLLFPLLFDLLGGGTEAVLDGLGEFLLAFDADQRVVGGHIDFGVAGDFRCFDGAAADRLPLRYVGAAERVRTESRGQLAPAAFGLQLVKVAPWEGREALD